MTVRTPYVYEEVSELADAANSWPWKEWRDAGTLLGWYKVGRCPRCKDEIAVYQRKAVALLETTSPRQLKAVCNCERMHDGRPESAHSGCGAYAWIDPREAT